MGGEDGGEEGESLGSNHLVGTPSSDFHFLPTAGPLAPAPTGSDGFGRNVGF